jgi:plasmid maintenance system antidote protein VapI
MPTQIQWRRGTTAQTASFTGATGEVTVDTTKKTLVVHDGVTPGGFPLSLESAQQDSFAYAHANSAYITANTANTGAINAGNYANSAYALANTKFNSSGGTISGNVIVTGNVTPLSDNTYYLGSDTYRWHSLFVGPGSVDIDGIVLSNVGGKLVLTGATDISFSGTSLPSTSAISNQANSAYSQANTATTNAATADQRAVTSGSYANSAYIAANTAITYTDNAIANLINSAPITLDTLNELAAALGDDPNFATTISTTMGITGSYANSAYSQANTATTNAATSDQRAVTSGVYANAAYTQANTATTNAATADQRAVTSGVYANGAFAAANTGTILAQAAFNKANTLFVGEETLTTNTANQVIDSYSTTEYRTAKYIIQAITDAAVHSEELLVTHNDIDVFFTEYAIITTANSLFNVYATIQSANVTINVSPVSANTQVDFSRISIIARELASLEGDLMSLSGTEDLESGFGVEDLMS